MTDIVSHEVPSKKQLCSVSYRILDKPKAPEIDDDRFFSKVVGDFTDRSKKLENELLRYNENFGIPQIFLTILVTTVLLVIGS